MPTNATESEGLRFYTWQGVQYPSVTTLRRLLGIPFGLATWMVNNALDVGLELFNAAMTNDDETVQGALRTFLSLDEKEQRKSMRKVADEKRDHSADLGTRVHNAADQRVRVEDAQPDEAPFLRWLYDFNISTGARLLASERQVFNLTLGYAGSFDRIVDIDFPEGTRRYVLDLKTGERLYADQALQVMGYGSAEFVGENDVINHDMTALLRSCTHMGFLHLRPDGWELVTVTPTPELYQAFERMVGLAHWFRKNTSIKPLVAEVLTSKT